MNGGPAARLSDYLEHIDVAIAAIAEYVAGMDEATFLSDRRTQHAVVWNLEVIGEACNNLGKRYPEFVAAHPGIPWTAAYKMRNALAHGYFSIDQAIVWRTIQVDLPPFRSAVAAARSRWVANGGS